MFFLIHHFLFAYDIPSQVTDPHFKWGFDFSPSRAFLWFRQLAGFRSTICTVSLLWRHCYFLPSSSLSFSSCSFIYLYDCFLVDISNRRYIVSTCPEMSICPFLSIFRMPVKQHQCTFSFKICHKI